MRLTRVARGPSAGMPPLIRLDYVDRLRGVAIAGVVLLHCGQKVAHKPDWLSALTEYGTEGVSLFFALSAFTLMTISTGRAMDFRSFYIRRFFRIAPMFYLATAFYLLLNGTGPQYYAPFGIGLRQVLLTLTFTHGFAFDAVNSIVPGGWSIAAEAMFYVLFPLLLTYLTTWRRTVIAASLGFLLVVADYAILIEVFGGWQPHYLMVAFEAFSFLDKLHIFIFGILTFQVIQGLEHHPELLERLKPYGLPILLLVSAGIAACALLSLGSFGAITDLAILLLIVAAFLHDGSATPLRDAARHVGQVSFSVYLVHFAVLAACAPLISTAGAPPVAALALLYVCVFAASIGIASLCRRYVELPMIELGPAHRR